MKGIGPVFRFNTYGRCALVGTADNAKESWQVGQVVEGGLGKKKDVRNMERAAQNVMSYVCTRPDRYFIRSNVTYNF